MRQFAHGIAGAGGHHGAKVVAVRIGGPHLENILGAIAEGDTVVREFLEGLLVVLLPLHSADVTRRSKRQLKRGEALLAVKMGASPKSMA
jgi:hypothetical protein